MAVCEEGCEGNSRTLGEASPSQRDRGSAGLGSPFSMGPGILSFQIRSLLGLCFAVMEEFVTDLHYYGWNASGILITGRSLEWAHST